MEHKILTVILIGSVALAWWAYRRAHRLHGKIERIHPGFNASMRQGGWRFPW